MIYPVSYLFVPGNRPDRFGKALESGADVVIVDLEDAVPAQDKPYARDEVRHWLAWHHRHNSSVLEHQRVVVRINGASTAGFRDDLESLRAAPPAGIMLSKAESAEQMQQVLRELSDADHTQLFVIPLVETALGVLKVHEIACAARVQRIAFGTHDYIADLGLSGDERGLLAPAALIAIASKAAGIGTPIAGVTTDIASSKKFARDLAFDRACGFGAKLCIHPLQVDMLHAASVPTQEELQWAQRVLAAASADSGAVQVDGAMVDRPVILKAQAILDRATKTASEQ